jgi:hypothetical protein
LVLLGCASGDDKIERVEALRGRRFTQPPRIEYISRQDWIARVRQEEEAWRKTESCRAYDVLWKTLGIVPPDADSQHWVYAIKEGYKFPYDPTERKIYLIHEAVYARDNFLVHEYIHVLQHQHSPLYGLPTDESGRLDDVMWAYSCVSEGEALLYELCWPSDDSRRADLEKFYRELPKTLPPLAQRWAYFPHIAGARYLMARGPLREAADRAWAQPPISTEQVLHPDRSDPPLAVSAPDLSEKLGPGWHRVVQTVLGEWTVADWVGIPSQGLDYLGAGLPDDLRWGGDLAQVYRHGDEWRVAVYLIWDDEASAKRFAGLVKNASRQDRWVVVFPDEAVRKRMLQDVRAKPFHSVDELYR